MSKVVVDTNVLFSFIISENENFKKFIYSKEFSFFSPNFVFVELFRYKEKILKYSKSNDNDLYELINWTINLINFVNEDFVSKESKKIAINLCKNIDEYDIPFVSLAIELDAYLWTLDKKLKSGLKKKGFNKFFDAIT